MGAEHSSSTALSASEYTVPARGNVDFSYNTNNEESISPVSSVFEVIHRSSGRVLHSDRLLTNQGVISYRIPPDIEGRVDARIVDTSITEEGQPKVLSKVEIMVTKPVITRPVPVDIRGVRLSLLSEPFCDCSQLVAIARDGGIQSGDFLEFHNSKGRVGWHWCQGKTQIDFGVCASVQDEQITVRYREEGGIFSSGSLIAEMHYTLRNPVQELKVSSSRPTIQEAVQVSYKMFRTPTNCMIVGRYHGVRIFTHAVSSLEGQCTVSMPRLPGEMEVVCIADNRGDNKLASEKLTVSDPNTASKVSISLRGYAPDHRILSLRPNQRFDVQSSGVLLNAMDEVVVIEAQSLFDQPTHTSLTMARQQKTVGEHGVCSLTITNEGIYHVCLALVHDRALLLGDWCSVVVSNRVGANIHPIPTEPISSLPFIPVAEPSNTNEEVRPPAGFVCAICLDKTVSMKFDPCKHVCTCEGCCQLVALEGRRLCPICKKGIDSWEKVFIA